MRANRRKRKVAGASLKGRNALLSVPSTPQNFINCAFCYADSCRTSLSLPTPGCAPSNLVCRPATPLTLRWIARVRPLKDYPRIHCFQLGKLWAFCNDLSRRLRHLYFTDASVPLGYITSEWTLNYYHVRRQRNIR